MHSMLANESYDEQDFYIPLQVANESMLQNDFRPRPPNHPNHGNRNPWPAPPHHSPRHGPPRPHNPSMSLASKQGRDQHTNFVKESFNQQNMNQSFSSDDPNSSPRVHPQQNMNQSFSSDDPNFPLRVQPPNHDPLASAQQALHNLSLGPQSSSNMDPMLWGLYNPSQPPQIPQVLQHRPGPAMHQASSPPDNNQSQRAVSPPPSPPPPPPGTTPPGPGTPSVPSI